MTDPPEVDGRRREGLRDHVRRIAPAYTEEWDPTSRGPGTALVALFAELTEDVVERLDRVPAKHRTAFFDRLGFDRRPPQPARVPVTFRVADGAGRNVVVDAGTQAVAKAANGRSEQVFEVAPDNRFEATPANLSAAYGIDPAVDAVYDHWSPPDGDGLEQGGEATLFDGTNVQAHRLYIGHASQLTVTSDGGGEDGNGGGGATIRIRIETDEPASTVRHELGWQYYGERVAENGEKREGWHTFPGRTPSLRVARLRSSPIRTRETESEVVTVDLTLDGTLTETTVNGVESLWIRAVVPAQASPSDLLDVEIGPAVEVGPGPDRRTDEQGGGADGSADEGIGWAEHDDTERTLAPDRLLYNDVPLPFATEKTEDGTEDRYYPLGTAPQAQDTFYVASDEAFTKAGARLKLSFSDLDGAVTSTDTPPELSWEYYDGNGWAKLPSLTDNTNKLTGGASSTTEPAGTAVVTVPEDLSKTAVAGHEHHWIRVRVAGGTYGKRTATETSDSSDSSNSSKSWETTHEVNPPVFTELTLGYLPPKTDGKDGTGSGENGIGGDGEGTDGSALPSAPATHLFAENNLAFGDNLATAETERVTPFERLPDDDQGLYLGFDARLHGAPLTLFFDIADRAFPEFFHSRVRWEYCADPATDEWVRLDTRDGTEGLTEQGIVSLVFPGESEACRRFGETRHWLRARVTGDSFVPEGRESTDTGDVDLGRWFDDFGDGFDLPLLPEPGPLTRPGPFVGVEPGGGLAGTGAFDAEGFQLHPRAGDAVTGGARGYLTGGESVRGIADLLPDGSGVDDAPRRLTAGDRARAYRFDTDVISAAAVSAYSTNAADAGRDVGASDTDATDVTAERVVDVASEAIDVVAAPPVDIVTAGLDLPEFDDPWIPLDPGDDGFRVPTVPRLPTVPVSPATDVGPCERTLPTEPPTGDATARPPTVATLAPNTTWLDNVRSVADETLGSSDGSQSQTFRVTSPPVVEETVWVDEAATLSAGRRQSLSAAETPATEEVTAPDGSLRSFWVRWRRVSDLLDSGEEERHYTVDRVAGRIGFGDGVTGRIPPRGENNVRVDYRTGGGTGGNVDAGTVAGLKSSLPFVDGVENPAPGTGGADAESTDGVLARAPRELRDRGRAVTQADFERVALDAARKLARVNCVPELNRNGEFEPGWVTLVLVPNAPQPKPVPSTGLKTQVETAVSERAPVTLVAADNLVVRGPSYVAVSVEATLAAVGSGSVATLEERVVDSLGSFLHPLSGGPIDRDEPGWPFGDLPTVSDLYALVEGVAGVDYVERLAVHYDVNGSTATVTAGEEPPSVSPDALVHSGTHDVTVTLGADTGGDDASGGS